MDEAASPPSATIDPKPWWQRRSSFAAVAGYLVDVAAIIALVADLLPPEKAALLIVLGSALARLQSIFSRMGGVNAAKAVGAGIEARNPSVVTEADVAPPGGAAVGNGAGAG